MNYGLIDTLLQQAHSEFFTDGATSTKAERFGLLLSRYFNYDYEEIIEGTVTALEDVNRLSLCDLIELVKYWPADQIRLLIEGAERMERTQSFLSCDDATS